MLGLGDLEHVVPTGELVNSERAPVLLVEVEIVDNPVVGLLTLLGGGHSSRLSGGRSGMFIDRNKVGVQRARSYAVRTVFLDETEGDEAVLQHLTEANEHPCVSHTICP